MAKMTVYHGSYTSVECPKIIKGKNTKDFGIGFYCTLIREQFWVMAKFTYFFVWGCGIKILGREYTCSVPYFFISFQKKD